MPLDQEFEGTLTPRERETLDLLAEGMSNKQIARALGISLHGSKRLTGRTWWPYPPPVPVLDISCWASRVDSGTCPRISCRRASPRPSADNSS
ncbi:LuxR C-terminal-related transcriptional regulator [Streptomyces sp. NPDC085479]|uniref:LuxR C-terminal-related transcriptional regulator n=1 Tax=Streptomyces sp. NPDC085479 TaxID=3365726 RepID=UPI0037CDBD14